MSYIKFTKNHPTGIKIGKVVEVTADQAKTFIEDKFAKESTKEEREKYLKENSGRAGTSMKELKKRSKEKRIAVNGTAKNRKPNPQAPNKDGE
jgi:phosphoribosyl-dephospho-CoA transferase